MKLRVFIGRRTFRSPKFARTCYIQTFMPERHTFMRTFLIAGLVLCTTLVFGQAGSPAQPASAQQNSAQQSAPQPKPASADDSLPSVSLHKWATDISVFASGGHTVSGGKGDTGVALIGARIGKVLTEEHGPGILRGNFEYAVGVVPFYAFPGPVNTAYGGGIDPFVTRWNFTSGKRVAPYFELAGGVVFTNTEVPFETSNINFCPQASIGMHIFTREKRSIEIEAKYMHVSNAGMTVPNPGLNTVQFGIGYHWMK